jgi:predicted ATP-grasp superfamily ATP-dependent carboligase
VGREAPGALISGGAHGSRAVARNLGRRGIPVWFATHDHPIAKYSRYVARSFEWAGPSDKGGADWLVELSASHRPERWVLLLVARNHAMLQRAYRVTTPLWEIVGIACDKRLTHEHAGAIGVDGPCWPRCVLGRTGGAWAHASRDVVSAAQRSSAGPYRPANIGRRRDRPRSRRTTPCPGSWICRS